VRRSHPCRKCLKRTAATENVWANVERSSRTQIQLGRYKKHLTKQIESVHRTTVVNWLTAFIALIVACITVLQWITARQKVLLDLFDKRYAVYEELREIIRQHVTNGVDSFEDVEKFGRATSRAQFLFGTEVTTFLEERLSDLFKSVRARKNHEPIPITQSHSDENEHFARFNRLVVFHSNFDKLVAPYMSHTQKRVFIPYIDTLTGAR
jgi:hypothetical protein